MCMNTVNIDMCLLSKLQQDLLIVKGRPLLLLAVLEQSLRRQYTATYCYILLLLVSVSDKGIYIIINLTTLWLPVFVSQKHKMAVPPSSTLLIIQLLRDVCILLTESIRSNAGIVFCIQDLRQVFASLV